MIFPLLLFYHFSYYSFLLEILLSFPGLKYFFFRAGMSWVFFLAGSREVTIFGPIHN